jgi:hypothetical protein
MSTQPLYPAEMTPDELARATAAAMYENDACSRALGLEIMEVRAGYARLRMAVRDDFLNGHQICHGEWRVLALRFFPVGVGGDAAQLIPRVHDGFERPVLRVRATGLEGHHEGLAGCVHHAIADLEAGSIQAREDFERYADPGLRACSAPVALRVRSGRQQRVGIRFGVSNAERKSER